MKLLLIHNYYRSASPSGEDAVARNERRLLEDYGVEVIPYEKFNDDIDDSALRAKLGLAAGTVWSRLAHGEVLNLIQRVKPDLAHIHSLHPQISPAVYSACKAAGVPVVHTLHNYRYICPGALLQRQGIPCEDCVGRWPLKALRHRCYRGSLAATGAVVAMNCVHRLMGTLDQVNRFVALTEFAKSRLVDGGLPSGRIEVKPNFLPVIPPSSSGRERYAVFVGRLSREKGVRTLVTAWREIDGIPLRIIGDGPLRSELESLAAELGSNVEFMGSRDRETVFSLVGKALCQVVPSEWYETFGMVVIEAYACGTPVVVSRIGALEEIVVDGETGLHFEAGNASDLAGKVRLLASDLALAQRMGAKARQLFMERYTPEQNFRMLMGIYRRAREDFETRGRG